MFRGKYTEASDLEITRGRPRDRIFPTELWPTGIPYTYDRMEEGTFASKHSRAIDAGATIEFSNSRVFQGAQSLVMTPPAGVGDWCSMQDYIALPESRRIGIFGWINPTTFDYIDWVSFGLTWWDRETTDIMGGHIFLETSSIVGSEWIANVKYESGLGGFWKTNAFSDFSPAINYSHHTQSKDWIPVKLRIDFDADKPMYIDARVGYLYIDMRDMPLTNYGTHTNEPDVLRSDFGIRGNHAVDTGNLYVDDWVTTVNEP